MERPAGTSALIDAPLSPDRSSCRAAQTGQPLITVSRFCLSHDGFI
jgi:hypothetical protein